jgi:hypothetical protein
MSGPIVSIERLQREAKAAAQTQTCRHTACPYPSFSEAAHVFMEAFLLERKAIEDAHWAARTGQ